MKAQMLVFDPLSAHLKRAANGDKKSAEGLVMAISPKLFRTAFRLLQNQADAEEAVQETLIKLWKIAAKWEVGRAKIETWCFRVLSNICFDKLRANSKYHFDEIDENLQSYDLNSDGIIIQSQLKNKIDNAIQRLPSRQQAAIILTYFETLSAKEVASALDTSIDAVESLLARAKKSLKLSLLNEDPEILEDLLVFGANG